jgi:hypothetical protein
MHRVQSNLSVFGRSVYVTLIARRSHVRAFALGVDYNLLLLVCIWRGSHSWLLLLHILGAVRYAGTRFQKPARSERARLCCQRGGDGAGEPVCVCVCLCSSNPRETGAVMFRPVQSTSVDRGQVGWTRDVARRSK